MTARQQIARLLPLALLVVLRPAASLGASSQVQATEALINWRPSRHARRLVTLVAAALLMALLTRNPALAGVAAPPEALLTAAARDPGGRHG